jgi:hypothetical protein
MAEMWDHASKFRCGEDTAFCHFVLKKAHSFKFSCIVSFCLKLDEICCLRGRGMVSMNRSRKTRDSFIHMIVDEFVQSEFGWAKFEGGVL